jgi:hypothetical protein
MIPQTLSVIALLFAAFESQIPMRQTAGQYEEGMDGVVRESHYVRGSITLQAGERSQTCWPHIHANRGLGCGKDKEQCYQHEF